MSSKNSTDKVLSFVINLLCHVFILLTFLTFFFFLYISKLTAEHIDTEMKSMVFNKTNELMKSLDQKVKPGDISWSAVNIVSGAFQTKCQGNLKSIEDNNLELYDSSICFLLIFGLVIIVLVCYFMIRNVNLGLKYIMVENFVIFAFVGMIEIYFFLNIASKYIPISPDTAVIAITDRLKYQASQ